MRTKAMNKTIATGLLSLVMMPGVWAQSPYRFTNERLHAATEAKNQCNTGTCWSYATTSFLESEIQRLGKGTHELSEMYNVRMTYPHKAETYLRFQGKNQFGPGALSHDVLRIAALHGLMPEEAYSGLNYGTDLHDHSQMDAMLEGILSKLVGMHGKLNPAWKKAIDGVLDAYLGAVPESFLYQGKKHTPASFRDAMGIVTDNYVSLSSFTHHPLYKPFVLEVPDNYMHGLFYNVTIDDMVSIVEHALEKGFTVAWDGDVSESGFSFKDGLAICLPEKTPREERFSKIHPEPAVTAEMRQDQYESGATTDDHLMHIIGSARDQNGNRFFIIKNSWGQENPNQGNQYMSLAYFRLKTVALLLHRDGIPHAVKGKLGLK